MSFVSRILILFGVIWVNYNNTSTISIRLKRSQSIHEDDAVVKPQRLVKCDENELLSEGELRQCIKSTNVISLNVGGEIMMTTRETLIRVPKSILSIMFNGDWEQKLPIDRNGNIFLDFNPIVFRHLLDQLQILDKNKIINFYPPSQPSLIDPFKKMLKKLNVNQISSLDNNIITFNVAGKIVTNQRKTFNQISNSTLDNIATSSKITKFDNKSNVFLDYDPKVFQHLVKRLREKSIRKTCYVGKSPYEETIFLKKLFPNLNICLPMRGTLTKIPSNVKWKSNGTTVTGQKPTLFRPNNLYVDDHQTIYVADYENHRIVMWKSNEVNGQIVAGGQTGPNGTQQLRVPTDVILDKETNSLIICDYGHRRVVRWPRQNGTSGKTIISDITCGGLTMDENGFLYVSDRHKHEVRRYRIGESQGTVVAGGNGQGKRLDQLNDPSYIFVNLEHSVFVCDANNHRVMKWVEGAKEGIVVAGGQGEGKNLTQLYVPRGVLVDQLDTVYVADAGNHRVVRWPKGAQQGSVIAGGNSPGAQANQLAWPEGMAFDQQGHLYVIDRNNHRVQRFTIEMPSN